MEDVPASARVVTKPNRAGIMQILSDPVLKRNCFAMFIIQSVTGFSMYMIGYYVKYFPGTIYRNMVILGLADTSAAIYMYVIGTSFKQVPVILKFILGTTLTLCIFYSVMFAVGHTLFLSLLIGLIRLSVTSAQCFSMDMIAYCFPPTLRITAFNLIQFNSRPFTVLALILVEYINFPIQVVGLATIASLSVISLI